MSDPTIKKNLAKSQDNAKELREYNSNKTLGTPTELLVEFLSSIMIKDYEMALKYCIEILRHEPSNTTALEFYPLIVEKLEMIKNEELESTSSETSLSTSSSISSSSSENIPFHKEFLDSFPHNWKANLANQTQVLPVEKINDCISSNPVVSEKEPANENTKTVESSIPLIPKRKNNFASPPKEELNMKITRNVTPLPSNLLIHPTQTITLIGKNVSKVPTRTPPRPKKDKKTPTAIKKQPSKLLLHTTRTITFPKRLPPRNFARTENPQ